MTGNLEHYKIFYYTAKLRSVTAAAEALCVSQPAVSQAVKGLEEELSCKLFVRTSRGVRLTREGETLFSYVAEGYEQIDKGVSLLRRQINLETGLIRIGASDMTLRFYLLPFLERFHAECPGIRIKVSNGPTPETLKSLREGRLDFGVVSSPLEDEKNLEVRKEMEISDVFVAGSGYVRLKGRELSFEELTEYPVIMLEKNTSTRTYVDRMLQGHGVTLRPEFELATSDMIVQFALRSLGIGSVMKGFASEYLASGELFELRFREGIPSRSFLTVTDPYCPPSAAAARLLGMMYSERL